MGSDQGLIARLPAPSGEVWGMLGLYRVQGEQRFDTRDKQFVRAVSYEPRFRENERRVIAGTPMRGGPVARSG